MYIAAGLDEVDLRVEWAIAVLLGLLVVLLAVLVWTNLRGGARRTGGAEGLLQQQLIELRHRLDQLAAEQSKIPEVLAAGRAEHATAISQEFSNLARLVATQLEVTQTTMGDRLDSAGGAISDVRQRLGELSEVTRRLEALGTGVADVQALLRVPRLRGTLGEVWLEELIGQVFPDGLFQTQYTFPTGDRVDAVLRIGGRLLSIDSKFPLEACQRMLDDDDGADSSHRAAFGRSVRARIDEIADRYILPGHGTFDFAMMYIPAERVYYEAMIRDGNPAREESLIGYAMARKVVPVSPNTFYAYLASVLHGLRGLEVEQRATELLGLLRELQLELDRFGRTHELVGRHLDNAAKQHRDAQRQLGGLADRFAALTEGERGDRPVVTDGP